MSFLLYALTVWSITRLLIVDEVPPIGPLRSRIVPKLPTRLAYLVSCPWCLSVYVGTAVWAALDYGADWSMPAPVLWIAAARVVTGIADTVEATLDHVRSVNDEGV